jgi:hypothetical protein
VNVSDAQRARGEHSPKHVAADETTLLRKLGDVIPVRPVQKVVSAGDVVLLLGVAAAVAGGMTAGSRDHLAARRRARRPALPREPSRPSRLGSA